MRPRNAPPGILPIASHLELVDATSFEYQRLDPRVRVKNEAAFDTMKSHIVDFYAGVPVVHSFEDAAGAVFDCIPIEKQPSLRDHEGPLPNPPDLMPVLRGGDPEERAVEPEPETTQRDRHGNLMQAPPGTVPIRRLVLHDVARFDMLESFFEKHPGARRSQRGVPRPNGPEEPTAPDANPGNNHRYAYTHQTVDNIGGHSALASTRRRSTTTRSSRSPSTGTAAARARATRRSRSDGRCTRCSTATRRRSSSSTGRPTTTGRRGAYNLTKPGLRPVPTSADGRRDALRVR